MRSFFVALVLCVGCGDYDASTDDLADALEGTGGALPVDETGGAVGIGGGSGGADVTPASGGDTASGGTVDATGGVESSGGSVGSGGLVEEGSGGAVSTGGVSSGGSSSSGGSGGSTDPVPSWSWTRNSEEEFFSRESPSNDGYMNIEVSITCDGWGPWSARVASHVTQQNLYSGDADVVFDWEIPSDEIINDQNSTPLEYFNCEGVYAGANRYITVEGYYQLSSVIGSDSIIRRHHAQLSSDVSISRVRVIVESVEWWEDELPSTYLSEHYTVELLP